MKRLMRKLTYTNVVGTLALFIALSGVSYAAATLPKNSVGSAQLKKSAVTSKAIKDKTITGSDIKDGSLTGGAVDVASLGTLPEATRAGSASSTAELIPPVVKRVAPSASDPSFSAAINAATPVVLFKNGQVSLYAKCFTSGSSVYGGFWVSSDTDGAISSYAGGFPYFYGSPGFLNPGQPDDSNYLAYSSAGPNSATAFPSPAYYGNGTVIGRDGNGFQYQVSGWVKNGTLAAGNGPYGPGNACLFTASGEKLTLG